MNANRIQHDGEMKSLYDSDEFGDPGLVLRLLQHESDLAVAKRQPLEWQCRQGRGPTEDVQPEERDQKALQKFVAFYAVILLAIVCAVVYVAART